MQKRKIISTLFLTCIFAIASSQKYSIRGTIKDAATGEQLIYGTVFDSESKKGSTSNNFGFYSLTLPTGTVKITFSYVGYSPIVKEFTLTHDTLIDINLITSNLLEEVVVTDKAGISARSTQMSQIELSVSQTKKLPVIMGETDILKTLQLMPGVKGGTEGTSGLYVRGGGPDQNLILLDGVPVYNVNHLFGFFSVFNADAIQNVSLLTGGFPARYGGRLSSVLDIKMKEGNNKKFKAVLSVGLIASQFTIEGPIVNEKTSFIVSLRRTYLDAIAYPFIKAYASLENTDFMGGYYFYDINAKINHTFSPKSRLYFSIYTGKDRFYVNNTDKGYSNSNNIISSTSKAQIFWGNITTALRWNYIITSKLFLNSTLTYSKYNFLVGAENIEKSTGINNYENAFKFEYNSGIRDFAIKEDFDFIPNSNHYIRFGVNAISHSFNPGINVFRMSNQNEKIAIDTSFGNMTIPAIETSMYAEDDWSITSKFKINVGLHYSGFYVKNNYYQSLQPRLSARYMITDKLSAKASYVHMTQYIHLLTNSSIGLPTDLWVPTTDRIKPQRAILYAAGTAYEINKMFDLSIEGYYKEMFNLIEYKEGASFFSMENSWENKVTTGKGWSYGGEILFRKNTGKLTGWIGYTLSWTNRQFPDISYGQIFPYRYDRRHDIGIAATYTINKRIDIGATWVYGSGLALTLPEQRYVGSVNSGNNIANTTPMNSSIESFSHRNSYRMPPYHRLDFGINFHKDVRFGKRVWSFGAYNAYNHQNPFYVNFGYDKVNNTYVKVLKQYSLFPIIPYFKYTLYFE